ncbi:MAG: EAL domain-containing protein [Steroidobacteraceae bacterium]
MALAIAPGLGLLPAAAAAQEAPQEASQEGPAPQAPAAADAQPGSRLLQLHQEVETRLDELSTVARDYAHWNDAYSFATGRRASFPGQGLLAPALARLDIHYMLVLDRRMNPRLSLSISTPPPRQAAVPANPVLAAALERAITAGELGNRQQNLRGLIEADGRLLLVAARPILPERGSAAPGGWLLLARQLDGAQLDEWLQTAEPAARSLGGEALRSAQLPPEVRGWLAMQASDALLLHHSSQTSVTTWFALRDLEGRALWAASIDTPIPAAARKPPAVAPTSAPAVRPEGEAKTGWIVALLAVLAALGFWAWRRHRGAPPAAQRKPAPVPAPASVPAPAQAPSRTADALPETASPSTVPVAQRVAADQLVVLYQPVTDLDSQRVCALEALPRWSEASRGWVLPDDPIAIVGPDGADQDVAQFVIGRVARDIRSWREQGLTPVPVSVNVAAGAQHRDRLRHTLQHLVDEDSLWAGLLQLEIADELLLDHHTGGVRAQIIRHWRELGLPLTIDHVGARARKPPAMDPGSIDALKLDAALVHNLAPGSAEGGIARAILREAQELNICVTAEGVDRWSQVELLRSLGCQQIQGPLVAQPAMAADAARFLRDGRIDMHDTLSDTDELPVLRMPQS